MRPAAVARGRREVGAGGSVRLSAERMPSTQSSRDMAGRTRSEEEDSASTRAPAAAAAAAAPGPSAISLSLIPPPAAGCSRLLCLASVLGLAVLFVLLILGLGR
jgi:hypothetical protein